MLFAFNNSKYQAFHQQTSKIIDKKQIKIQLNQKTSKNIIDSFNKIVKQKYGRKFTIISEKSKPQQNIKERPLPIKNTKMQETGTKIQYHSQKKQYEKQKSIRHFKRNTWNSNTPSQMRKHQKPYSQLSKQSISKRHTTTNQLSFNMRINNRTSQQLETYYRKTCHEACGERGYSKIKKISYLSKLQKITLRNQKHSLVDLINKYKFENLKSHKDLQDKNEKEGDSVSNSFLIEQQKKNTARWFFSDNQDGSLQNNNFQNYKKITKSIPKRLYKDIQYNDSNREILNLNVKSKSNLSPWVTTNDFYLNHENIIL